MKKVILHFILLISFYGCVQKKNNETDSSYLYTRALPSIETFFSEIQSGNYKIAIDELFSKNHLQDSVANFLKKKFDLMNETSGNLVSKRFLRKKEIGDDLGVYTYFVSYEKRFFRFTFIFYNNGSQVKIYKYSFDDTIDYELEEAIKMYMN